MLPPPTAPSSPLSAAERATLAALAAAWVVPAWWLGASTPSGQAFAAGAGAAALVFARLAARRRLVAWPTTDLARAHSVPVEAPPSFHPLLVFCIVAFLALLLSQAINPDRLLTPDRRPVGVLTEVAHRAWLPTGIAGPFDTQPGDFLPFANAWRHLLAAAAVVLPLAALALLPRRIEVLRGLITVLALHALLFSAFALAHNLSGSHAVLWLYSSAAYHLGAPQFPFKNQQAAYQLLLLAFTLSLWFAPAALRPWTRLRRPALWLGVATAIVFLGTATTRSRVALGGAVLLAAFAAVLFIWPARRDLKLRPRRLAFGAVGAVAAAGLLTLLPPVRATVARLVALAREPRDLLVGGSYRRILQDIAWQMTLDRPWFGHGAGAYVILFPEYQKRVPAFAAAVQRFQPDWNRPVHPHADGDWVEFTAEYGFAGTALFLAPWLIWLGALRRHWPLPPAAALLAVGTLLVLAHGWIDFVLRNPAVLGLAAALAVLALRFTCLPTVRRLSAAANDDDTAGLPSSSAFLRQPRPSA